MFLASVPQPAPAGTSTLTLQAASRKIRERLRDRLPADGWPTAESLVAVLEADQRERWHRGDRITAESYLDAFPNLRGHARAFSLILGELYLRQAAGETIAIADFRERFPEFKNQLDVLGEGEPATADAQLLETEPAPPKPDADPDSVATLCLAPDWIAPALSSESSSVLPSLDGSSAVAPPAAQGQRVGPFEIVRTLARGGMGMVYQAIDTRLNREVALKMILAGAHAEPQALARFRHEAWAVARLQHSNIVQIFEVAEHEGLPYIALEYIDGVNLQQMLGGKSLPPKKAAEVARTLARAIDFAHQRGIIHRDLKPGNILIGSDGQPKITDFGLAKLHKATDTHSRPGEVIGTPNYMAPEQADGHPDAVGPATDVYSLGAVLYEMLAGEPPFAGCSPMETLLRLRLVEPVPPRQFDRKIPRDLETICLKCLRKDRSERYASAAALADDLDRYLQDTPILARPVDAHERVWKWARRHPAIATLGAVLAALIIVGYALVFFQWQAAVAARNDARWQYFQMVEARTKEGRALTQAEEAITRHTRSLYAHVLTNANLEFLTGDAAMARHRLDSCAPYQRGWEWHYLRRRIEGTDVTVANPPGGPAALMVLPNGKEYLTLGAAGLLEVHDLTTGRPLASRPLLRDKQFPEGWGFGLGMFSADGALLAAACIPPTAQDTQANSVVGVWETATGRLLQAWTSEAGRPTRLAFRPDGQRLAWTSGRLVELRGLKHWQWGEVRVVDVRTGQTQWYADAADESWVDLAYSPDGRRLALTSARVPLLLCDAETGVDLLRRDDARLHGRRVLFLPDGQRIVVQGDDIMVLFTMQGQRRNLYTTGQDELNHIFLSPDGKRLAVAASNNTVHTYDTDSWNRLQRLVGHVQWVGQAAFAPGNRALVTQSLDGTTKVWDLEQNREPIALGRGEFEPGCWLPSTVVDEKRQRLYVAADDRQIHLFDLTSHAQIKALQTQGDVRWLALSPDGTKLAAGYDEQQGHIGIWDLENERETLWPDAHRGCLTCVAFSRDGKRLASASEDGVAKVWDLATRTMVAELRGHKGYVNWISFGPTGRDVITAGADGTVRFWNAATGITQRTITAHATPVTCGAISPDGRWLATANTNRDHADAATQIKIWDVASGELLRTMVGHRDSIWHLAFSPDGKRLASAGEDWTVKIWEPEAGDLLLTLKGHGDDVRCVSFSPDGHHLYSSGDDAFIRGWDATPLEK